MERKYTELCRRHGYKAKVFCKPAGDMKNRIGRPDLLILFTHTVSHKMVQCALTNIDEKTRVVRSHKSSIASLKDILEEKAV